MKLLDVVKSNAEAEGSAPEDWLHVGSYEYLMSRAPFKEWKLEKLSPEKIKPHHDNQDPENIKTIRRAKGPDDIPPVIVDTNYKTVDGAHRSLVSREDKWPYIWAWVPVASSKLSDKELEHVTDTELSNKELLTRIEKLDRSENQKMKLEHYSDHPKLDEVGIDPRFHGTGVPGSESKRKAMPDWVDRSYHYVAGTEPEKMLAGKLFRYTSEVPDHKIYDYQKDPLNLREKSKFGQALDRNMYEKNIRDSGYLGYINRGMESPTMSNVVALFHPIIPRGKTMKHRFKDELEKQDGTPMQQAATSIRSAFGTPAPTPPPSPPPAAPAASTSTPAPNTGSLAGNITAGLNRFLGKSNMNLKKDDMPHTPESPEDKAHDVVEEGQSLQSAMRELGSSEKMSRMLQHIRNAKSQAGWERSEANQAAGADTHGVMGKSDADVKYLGKKGNTHHYEVHGHKVEVNQMQDPKIWAAQHADSKQDVGYGKTKESAIRDAAGTLKMHGMAKAQPKMGTSSPVGRALVGYDKKPEETKKPAAPKMESETRKQQAAAREPQPDMKAGKPVKTHKVGGSSPVGSVLVGAAKKSEKWPVSGEVPPSGNKSKLEKKQGVPKGADPATHERCVKELKAKGHDKSSAYAICNAAGAGMKKADAAPKKQITMPTRELIAEHKRLVGVLESPSHLDDKAEAKEQKKELAEYQGMNKRLAKMCKMCKAKLEKTKIGK